MEQALNQLWQKWQRNGASPDAEPLVYKPGWTLSLCFRARVTAIFIFLLFAGGLVGVLLLHAHDPIPPREFKVMLAGYCVLASFACYYLGFVFWYRVILDEGGIDLRRLLLPARRIEWQNVARFEYQTLDETVKIFATDKSKIGLYLSLHGLSAVRRCLAKLVPQSEVLEESWIDPDTLLMEHVPSWRCQDIELERDPFVPLEEM